jgi:hypothetical protein
MKGCVKRKEHWTVIYGHKRKERILTNKNVIKKEIKTYRNTITNSVSLALGSLSDTSPLTL